MQVRHTPLERRVGGLQLPHVLCREVALGVDLGDESRTRRDRPLGASSCLLGFSVAGLQLPHLGFEPAALLAQGVERAAMRGHAPPVDRVERANQANEPAESLCVGGSEQEPAVPVSSVLVDLDHLGLDGRELRETLLFEIGHALAGLTQGAHGGSSGGFGSCRLLATQRALHLELLQLAEHRPRPAGKGVGLAFQRQDPGVDPAGFGVRGRSGLRAPGHGHERQQRRDAKPDRRGEDPAHCGEVRELYGVGRLVGIDVGARRIGFAVSDATCTLARPLAVVRTNGIDGDAVNLVAAEVARLAAEEDGVTAIVVGLPRRLDGSASDMTPLVESFARRLERQAGVPVRLQDERLSSREAESRLAIRERDWRARKRKLDAAAAAVILQDHLDALPRERADRDGEDTPV